MHELNFADAAIYSEAKILGLVMLPYSIGHEILLTKQRNPIALMSHDAFMSLDSSERASAVTKAVLGCCKKTPKFLLLWGSGRRVDEIDDACEQFMSYRAAGSLDLPTVPQPKTPGAPFHYFGSPELARLLVFVCQNNLCPLFGVKSAFDFPLGLARMLYLAHFESKGSLWVENRSDVERKQQLAAFEAANPHSTLAVGAEAVREFAKKWNAEHPEAKVPVM